MLMEAFEHWVQSIHPLPFETSMKILYDYSVPLAISLLLYLPTIFLTKAIMKDKQQYDLRTYLFLWNAFLAFFSLIGTYYMIRDSIIKFWIEQVSISELICDQTCSSYSTYRWIFYFNFSKVFEFLDTVFIVLRKKPLIFLHWYHHVATMMYCWWGIIVMPPVNCTGWFFALMNLIVHSMMYTYYALTALDYRPSWAVIVTSLQISQMFGGIIVLYISMQCHHFTIDSTFWVPLLMYASYLILFLQIFGEKYIFPSKDQSKTKVE